MFFLSSVDCLSISSSFFFIFFLSLSSLHLILSQFCLFANLLVSLYTSASFSILERFRSFHHLRRPTNTNVAYFNCNQIPNLIQNLHNKSFDFECRFVIKHAFHSLLHVFFVFKHLITFHLSSALKAVCFHVVRCRLNLRPILTTSAFPRLFSRPLCYSFFSIDVERLVGKFTRLLLSCFLLRFCISDHAMHYDVRETLTIQTSFPT